MNANSRSGFTLIELLVVVTIILILMTFTVAAVNFSLESEKVSSSARQVQSYLEGARDRAIRAKEPRGVRFYLDTTSLPGSPDPVVQDMVYIRPAETWTEGLVRVARSSATGNPVPNIISGSYSTFWEALRQRNLLIPGIRMRIPNDRTGAWYTITALLPLGTSGGSNSGDVSDQFPFRVQITPPFRDSGVDRSTDGSNTNTPVFTYALELPPVVLPNQPSILADGTSIDLLGSQVPLSNALASVSAGGYFDIMFTSRGTVMGTGASSGLLHLYVSDLAGSQLYRDFIVEQDAVLGGLFPRDVPADELEFLNGEVLPLGERRVVTIFTQTGAISTHPIAPDDVDGDGNADDPFFYAESAEVGN